jgi:hypothetical protein
VIVSISPAVIFKADTSSFEATQNFAKPPAQAFAQSIVKPVVKQDILLFFNWLINMQL